MTIIPNEDAQVLTNLGLTELQAQVYLTLAKMEKGTLRSLSATSKIDRANVYRVLTRLIDFRLVEKFLTNPTVFRALPANEGIKMLLDQKEAEHKDIKAKTEDLLRRYQQNTPFVSVAEDCEFMLIPDGRLTKRKVDEMINSNYHTHDVIIYWNDFESQSNQVVDMWCNILLKDIAMRAIVFLTKNEKLSRGIIGLKKFSNFQIRQSPSPPKATLSIIDGKEALVSVTASLLPRGKPGLWVNNPCVVGLIQEYFEMIWQKSKKIN
jgi:sugar-specific transcriptional regulator TrmB